MYARDVARAGADGARATGTAIYFLLRAGERSHWHRVDATEIWHHYAGDALRAADERRRPVRRRPATLGTDLAAGPAPAGRRAARRLAGRALARRVDARGLHRLARFRVRGIRARRRRAGNRREADLTSLTRVSVSCPGPIGPDADVRGSRNMTNVDLVRLAGSRGRISDAPTVDPSPPRSSAAAWRPSASRWRSTSRAPRPRRSSTSRTSATRPCSTRTGRLAALSVGIPQFMLTSTLPVRFALEFLGVDEFREGDVFVANDPYHGGGHLPDYNVFAPVFADDAATAAAAHGADREHPVPPRRHRRRRARRLQHHRRPTSGAKACAGRS